MTDITEPNQGFWNAIYITIFSPYI